MLQQEIEEDVMLRKAVVSTSVALFVLSLLVMGVMAQGITTQPDEDAPVITVQPNVAAASVAQTVPVTLTLMIPGPTGPVTVEVPIFLSLDIRIGISPELTTTVAVTPSVVTEVDGTAFAPDADTEEASEEGTVEATVESTVAAPTAVPTPTPNAVEPTPEPDESEAIEAEATAPPLPTATPESADESAEPVVDAPLCPDPRAVIVAPGVGQVLAGDVNMLGSATHENFGYYKIEYALGANVDADDSFVYLADARTQVTGGVLASFDSTNFDNGEYTLKLTVVDASGNFPPPCTVSVVIAN
jgi:hypothetical protein